MKIYTKKGDQGKTSLIGGRRVSKADHRIEAYGTVDELNSYIGVIQSYIPKKELLHTTNNSIQNNLFVMGSLLAADPGNNRMELPTITDKDVELLEKSIDAMNEELTPLTAFILPTGHESVAHIHVARCICRRAERICVGLADVSEVESIIIIYLNRLSDYLFTLARKVGKDFGVEEVVWKV